MELIKSVQKKKKVKVSKNKKRNWRKHTDFEDAEEFLADQQLQERTGGVAADKPDEQLFFVDSKAETEEPKGKKRKQKKDVSAIYRNLLPDSEPAPETKMNKKVAEKRLKQAVKTVGRKSVQPKQEKPKKQYTPTEDLWAAPAAVPEILHHHNRVTRQTRVKRLPYTQFRTSTVPAVQTPHAGASYNPDPEALQELLREAHEVEVAKELAELKLKRKLDDMFPNAKNAPSEASYLREMSAGLGGAVDVAASGDESSSQEEGGEEEEEGELRVSVGPPSNRDKKKTPQRRRKAAERKRQAIKEKQEKALEAKERQMYRLRSIKKNIDATEVQKADREWRKATEKAESVGKTKKLGKIRYEDPDVEVKLSGEMTGSLRLLKPEGHLLEDRYKSLQKRNIIEPREKQNRKLKYKMKKFEKAGHKAVTLQS